MKFRRNSRYKSLRQHGEREDGHEEKGKEGRRRDAPYRLVSTYKIDCCSLTDFSSDPDRTASIDPLIEAVGSLEHILPDLGLAGSEFAIDHDRINDQTSTYIIYADTKKTLSDPTICVLYLATLFIVQSCVERRRGRAFDQTTSEDQVIHTLTHNYCERNIPTSNF